MSDARAQDEGGFAGGRSEDSYHTEGRISIHVVAGHIQVRAEGRTFDLPAGTLVARDQGLPHDVEALVDSAILLTIAWPGRSENRAT